MKEGNTITNRTKAKYMETTLLLKPLMPSVEGKRNISHITTLMS